MPLVAGNFGRVQTGLVKEKKRKNYNFIEMGNCITNQQSLLNGSLENHLFLIADNIDN